MKYLLGLTAILALFAAPAYATEYTSTSCTTADIQSKMTSASSAGDGVFLDCASTTLSDTPGGTSLLTWTAPANGYLRCRGRSTGAAGTDDLTVITDGIDRSGFDYGLMAITISGTGMFQIYGCTFQESGASYSNQGIIRISGASGAQVRLHHNHYDVTGDNASSLFSFFSKTKGVIDHNEFEYNGNIPIRTRLSYPDYDTEWASDTNFGTNDFIFIEDNIFSPVSAGGGAQDAFGGARFVVRYNAFNCASTQNHGIQGNRERSARAMEIYGNTTAEAACDAFSYFFEEGGGALVWGNTYGTNRYQHFIVLQAYKRTNTSYTNSPAPDGWGPCGPAKQTGVVDTSGTAVTWVSGSQFDTGWLDDFDLIVIGGTIYKISDTASATALTLTSSAGTQNDVTYEVGSYWDENTGPYGRRCLDQPGNGKGDLITGEFPNATNDSTGKIGTESGAWPQQQLEPLYEWLNVGSCSNCSSSTYSLGAVSGGVFAENYNYYKYDSTATTSMTNQTVGVRSGTIANRPGTCTTGVAYWSTDEGEWNSSNGATADGKLYLCTATDTWTASYGAFNSANGGTPYTYPHPLVDASEESATEGAGKSRLRLRIR